MIEKRTITCCILLVLTLLTKLYSSSNDNVSKDKLKHENTTYLVDVRNPRLDTVQVAKPLEVKADLFTFADEGVPVENPAVKGKLNKYLKRFSYSKLQSYRMHRKADQHLPRIAKILAQYDIPEDFKYIPVVESDLDPKTTSHAGAGGYWQFIPSTARLYGLKVNAEVDERLDLVKSTHAAAKYLKYLHKQFGDWTLVAAAYNVGGGSLKRSMRRQGKDSYYNLDLNSETGSYIYKLVSVKEVIEKPVEYGYKRLAKASLEESSTAHEPEIL